MPAKPTIHVHCFTWNDAALLPYFFRHYASWVDHFHFWDLDSQDGTREWIGARADATLHTYQVQGDSLVDTQRALFDSVWQRSRGQADWVLMVTADEHLQHPDLPGYLVACADDGVTAVKAIGYEMVSDRALEDMDPARPLSAQVTQGCRSPGLDRLVVFSPTALTATHFAPGQHYAWPEGHVVWPASPELLLLRFQILGEARFLAQTRARAQALLPGDREHGWAAHFDWTDDDLRRHVADLRQRARTVPGLGDLTHLPPGEYRGDEKTIERSGLLDVDWYELNNPDIAGHQFDALTHFCEYGWREGRAPNPYFHPAWYSQTQGLAADVNPLIDYIRRGEREGAWPSVHFDPVWYRATHQLGEQDSPLAHYLARRHDGQVSPLPGFDVAAYLQANPQAREESVDPYLHSLAAATPAAPSPAPLPDRPLPTWEQILQQWQPSQDDTAGPASVPLPAVQDVLRQFVAWLPFDAAWYLRTYPDVAQAVAEGAFASAHEHFIEHGFFEGRSSFPGTGAPA